VVLDSENTLLKTRQKYFKKQFREKV